MKSILMKLFKEEDNQEIVGGEDDNKETAEQPESKVKVLLPRQHSTLPP